MFYLIMYIGAVHTCGVGQGGTVCTFAGSISASDAKKKCTCIELGISAESMCGQIMFLLVFNFLCKCCY